MLQKINTNSKIRIMSVKSENRISVELIRYYQQKDALLTQKSEYEDLNNITAYKNLLSFYSEKIETLKKQLYEINPEKLKKIEQQRANDCTVNGAEIIAN